MNPFACPYFEAATRTAARVTADLDMDAMVKAKLQDRILMALLDAWESGRCMAVAEEVT